MIQVYHGPAQSALDYFSDIGKLVKLSLVACCWGRESKSGTGRDVHLLGYTCEPHNNPADFFLDVINGDSSAVALGSKNEEGAF